MIDFTKNQKHIVSFRKMLVNFSKGLIIGIVETLPGFSVSTFAFIMEVYKEFLSVLHAIADLFREFLKFMIGKSKFEKVVTHFKEIKHDFGISLSIGILLGLGLVSLILNFALENFPAYTNALFFGLILASFGVPLKQVKKLSFKSILILILTTLVFFYLFGLRSPILGNEPSKLLIFISGIFSSCALVLPGVSVSFMLLLFDVYAYMIGIVNNVVLQQSNYFELTKLFIFFVGLFLGIITLISLLKKIVENYKPYFMAFVSGIMLASLRLVYPFITVKGHTVIYLLPWTMTLGQSVMIAIIIVVAYLVCVSFNKSIIGKDDTIEKI